MSNKTIIHFPGVTKCIDCNSDKTLMGYDSRSGNPHWYWYKVGSNRYVCNVCEMRRIYEQKQKERRSKRHDLWIHHTPGETTCSSCRSTKTLIRRSTGGPVWYFLNRHDVEKGLQPLYICSRCYDRKTSKKHHDIQNTRR